MTVMVEFAVNGMFEEFVVVLWKLLEDLLVRMQ